MDHWNGPWNAAMSVGREGKSNSSINQQTVHAWGKTYKHECIASRCDPRNFLKSIHKIGLQVQHCLCVHGETRKILDRDGYEDFLPKLRIYFKKFSSHATVIRFFFHQQNQKHSLVANFSSASLIENFTLTEKITSARKTVKRFWKVLWQHKRKKVLPTSVAVVGRISVRLSFSSGNLQWKFLENFSLGFSKQLCGARDAHTMYLHCRTLP